ncbi:alpha/beta fold hydrolase [Nocardioides convexus]|uniref:alpha/beta fold hydrolase n=1 Tax=Nocardioides convexus TaxID=2712224 RepID=UPI0024184ABC|nr:alpha/beta fold hydrolase [Nocardioides convexus]
MAETTTRITSVTRDGLVLDVRDEGPVDGEVVVLLHGFPERATCWRYVAPILHQAGYRTLAMDQRGYAPGARPRGRRAYRMRESARRRPGPRRGRGRRGARRRARLGCDAGVAARRAPPRVWSAP